MKKIISCIIILLFVLQTASAQFIKADLQAAGLTCSMCSRAVDKQLRTLSFVDSVGIDLEHTLFIIYFKKDKLVDFSQIKKKIEDAGFTVASLKPVFKFSNQKIESGSSFVYQNITYNFIKAAPQTLDAGTAFTIVDKGFVTDKEYRKYAGHITATKNVYHVIL